MPPLFGHLGECSEVPRFDTDQGIGHLRTICNTMVDWEVAIGRCKPLLWHSTFRPNCTAIREGFTVSRVDLVIKENRWLLINLVVD